MAIITVDGKGFGFGIKLVAILVVCAGLYSLWKPVHQVVVDSGGALEQLHASVAQSIEIVPTAMADRGVAEYISIDFEKRTLVLVGEKGVTETYNLLRVSDGSNGTEAVPQGEYTVDEKVKKELSSVTLVSFPYYVQFGDNFAVHGLPVKNDGTTVPTDFAGNMITLALPDAQEVYEFVKAGMLVVVEPYTPQAHEDSATVPVVRGDLPATTATAYALKDLSTGNMYLSQNGDARYPIASVTKLVTAIVATDVIGHGTEIMAPSGEYYTLSDLYYPLLLRSDNAVAQRIGVHQGLQSFIGHMNTYVRALGMHDTSFADTSGLSPKNISTTDDLLVLARHLYTQKPFILDITKEEAVTITSRSGAVWSMENQNMLASDPYFRGGKLGYTDEAQQTSLAIFNVPIGDEVHPVAVVVLQSKDWKQDTRTLLRWLVEGTK